MLGGRSTTMNVSTIGQDACTDGTSYCPQCGSEMEALACYCSQCGTKVPGEYAAQAQKRLSVEPVTLLPAQMLGSRFHSKYYGRLICADNALYFIQGCEVSVTVLGGLAVYSLERATSQERPCRYHALVAREIGADDAWLVQASDLRDRQL